MTSATFLVIISLVYPPLPQESLGTVSEHLGPETFQQFPSVTDIVPLTATPSPLPHIFLLFRFQKLNFTERIYNFVQEDTERAKLLQSSMLELEASCYQKQGSAAG